MGSLIRASTVIAKFRLLGRVIYYQIGPGSRINIQEGVGFGDVLAMGGG